ncbi:hypothetical protein DIS24_g1983 [Lasiodiplodia hormozganensis]|uniref:BTB domain-containing protein n=1 Tax=Lasiodiplodia hormozganensis TaxID=869390 RepID=A0AA40D4C6_9PEZI|nr:hypothetical protein DIS24_g1983 [Lasiodiplodia hormozganensis]
MASPTPPPNIHQTVGASGVLGAITTHDEPVTPSPKSDPIMTVEASSSPPSSSSVLETPQLPSLGEDAQPRKRQKTLPLVDAYSVAANEHGSFPYFANGDVVITIKDSTKLHVWRLHSTVIAISSTKMRELLARADNLQGEADNHHYLTLDESVPPHTTPLLIPARADQIPEDVIPTHQEFFDRSLLSTATASSRATSVVTTIKSEDQDSRNVSQRHASRANLDARIRSELCSAYDKLFRHMYHLPLHLGTTANAQHCLFQAEVIVPVFREYGFLPSLQPHLRDSLSQLRFQLFEAIAKDPCRWLNLSIPLESTVIYMEACIHLTGSFDKISKPDKTRIPHDVLNKVKKKREQLMHAQEKVLGELFRLTIHVEEKPVTMVDQMETWIAVQIFRDWLARELDRIERQTTRGSQHSRGLVAYSDNASPPGIGTLLRRIHRGGDAYLAYDKVLKDLKESHEYLGSEWEDLAEDLRSLKKFASKAVESLCRNNLMLDPELHKIPYLTCVDVGMRDLPWQTDAEGP